MTKQDVLLFAESFAIALYREGLRLQRHQTDDHRHGALLKEIATALQTAVHQSDPSFGKHVAQLVLDSGQEMK